MYAGLCHLCTAPLRMPTTVTYDIYAAPVINALALKRPRRKARGASASGLRAIINDIYVGNDIYGRRQGRAPARAVLRTLVLRAPE